MLKKGVNKFVFQDYKNVKKHKKLFRLLFYGAHSHWRFYAGLLSIDEEHSFSRHRHSLVQRSRA